MDELTLHVAREWLDHRRHRWPNAANLHLLINKFTAFGTGPVGAVSRPHRFAARPGTLEQLGVDRQLDEPRAYGPDSLDLAGVFGLGEKTALRYAGSARALLECAVEQRLR
ncbi:hypothetical protein ACIPC1_39460 [Streptomyces sp. NPDC087263]|uniref:hypothetical protein n=1 Tax=Streptomyces sp. NPDC087263 TaxID=3365773 RepID=UPI003804B5E3